ncbi:MAG: hypothetical protein ACXVUX_12225 [Solirubrobacteraceae bacterium]
MLSDVACASPDACTAVGYAVNAAGVPAPLVERWNGNRWTIQRSVVPARATSTFLFGVSCPAARSCTAVGSVTRATGGTVPLAERWTGSRWLSERISPLPRRPRGEVGYLGAVSCPTRGFCAAVGYVGNLQGTRGRTVAERWTRARGWTLDAAPAPGGAQAAFLSGVSCPSVRRCAAVGFSTGRSGAGAALAERWNPAGWAIQRIPTPAAAAVVQLNGVACPSPSSCTAVGSFQVAGIEVLLTERWDGSRWVIGHPRYPAGAREVRLSGVSCPTASACTAVGSFTDTAGLDEPLAERWTPRGWAIQRTPAPDGAAGPANAELAAVSCGSAVRCLAVGSLTALSGGGGEPASLSWHT